MEHNVSAFNLKLEFLFNNAQLPGYSAEQALRHIAEQDAKEDNREESPLLELLFDSQRWWRKDAEFLYQRAYWGAKTEAKEAFDYFDVRKEQAYIVIKSKNVDGGSGQVRLHRSHIHDFFDTVKYGYSSSYADWCEDLYPVGGRTVLLRMTPYLVPIYDGCDDDEMVYCKMDDKVKGMLCLDPDTHPSSGQLCLGHTHQEARQLGLLGTLRDHVLSLAASVYSPPQKEEIEARAIALRAANQSGFMPSDGICSWCEQDVTQYVHSDSTGCPLCSHTWVD